MLLFLLPARYMVHFRKGRKNFKSIKHKETTVQNGNITLSATKTSWRRTLTFEITSGQRKSFKNDRNLFYFTLQAPFILDTFSILILKFFYAGKRLDKNGKLILKLRHKLDNKQLRYTYYQLSQEVKAIRQWNLDS